ncbi:phage tail protein [Terrabacter sp. Root181]|uniref:phage tail protein n=1 Tax=Terrabacter sp. Root181 TaxID=1736484 RepID=UPI0006F7C1AE|nr:phage tail protein [Terrabacter sp. Root181]KRB43003.1 phage tail protein [Terrabacter sp. Root181]
MATERLNPYGAFSYMVEFGEPLNGGGHPIQAGFSDVSGLGNEVNYSEYRTGVDAENTVRKIPNTFKIDEITLKRGLIGSTDIFQWITDVRNGAYQPRSVTIVMLDEARNDVLHIVLTNAQPKKWVGPTLAAKGGGEVAMEELHLVAERIDFE